VHALHGPRYDPQRLRRGEAAAERGDAFDLLFRVVGAGTRSLAERRPGDSLDVMGPLGRPFEIRPDLEQALLVAGGAGIAPIFFLAQELRARGKPTTALVGAAGEQAFPLEVGVSGGALHVPALEAMGVESSLVTEKEHGLLVTQSLQEHLGRDARDLEVFACGPMGMLAEVARIVGEAVPCQVLLEERMCCGLGACRGCVIRVRDREAPEGFALQTVCGDGPVFRARDVLWE